MRPLIAALVLVGVAAGGLAGCGADDGPGPAERARLADSLGFLGTDLGLTDEEIACTARAIEEQLDGEGDDLDAIAAEVRRVDAGELALEDMSSDLSDLLLTSVTACAGTAS